LPAPETALLGEWLRNTVALTPDAPAIVEEERVTSFRELCEQADALARRFVACGVQRQDRIALVMPKTTDAIICVFASLFSGAMYVPIHPKWPKDRIEATLEDCDARLVIEGGAAPSITDRRSGESTAWQSAATGAGENTLPEVDAEDAAFILFTSGSTGRAKGVVLSHRAVSAFVRWSASEFHVCASDRIACPSPLGFDLSTFDIFNMALCGATCVLVPEHIVWMPRFVVQFVRESHITCWYSVPSILAGMLQEGRLAEHEYPALRLILFAGEVFPAPQVQRLQAAIPQAELANLYGPTETNVVTWYGLPRDFDGAHAIPIGRACPYAAITMDSESGELLAGGASLMSGYWNRAEETQRAFVTLGGTQYYRTGDRVSCEPDGNYGFIGRLDRQVKRRGFRIELGEIEAALLQHEDILEVAAVSVEDQRKGTVIVAFVRSRSGVVALAEVKSHCARTLPLYMLPDHILSLDKIPKGARGKIDYLALGKLAEGPIRGD
jgi:amino acid adenylation domain-containing protein